MSTTSRPGADSGGRVLRIGMQLALAPFWRAVTSTDELALNRQAGQFLTTDFTDLTDLFRLGLWRRRLGTDALLAGLSWPWGGMAENATLNEYNLQAIPDAMSNKEAALVEPGPVAGLFLLNKYQRG